MFHLIGTTLNRFQGIGLLALRVPMGAAFVLHGLGKVQSPEGMFGWMKGSEVPDYMQAAAALAELVGGGLLAVGLFTRLAALALAGVMAGAFVLVHIPNEIPFVATAPGQISFEVAAIYLACAILLVFIGPGVFSVDAILFRRKPAVTSGG